MDALILKEAKATDHQAGQLVTKRNTLRRRIDKWRDIQAVYLPSVAKYWTESVSPDDAHIYSKNPETIPLHLPSALPTDIVSTIPPKFFEIETRLRISQADDSLYELKRLLRITMGLWVYKHAEIGPSQRSGTRMNAIISTFQERVSRCAERYRAAHRALSTMDPGGIWADHLQELKTGDVRPPVRDMDKVPKPKGAHKDSRTSRTDPEASEGRRTLSWIWLAACPKGTESGGGENGQTELQESKSHNCSHWGIELIT